MSVLPNTFIEPFNTSVKDIWSVTPVSNLDEIHKDLYIKLSKQAEEIAELKRALVEVSVEQAEIDHDMKMDAAQAKLDQEEIKKGWEDVYALKAEIETLKRVQVEMKSEMKAEISSLLSGDFYIHAGGSPHGKISSKSGGTGGYCSLLSQDHLVNRFTGYDVAADGTVKVNCSGKDDCYPITQRWSFERATDKLINHPDGSHRLMSIPLNT
jgi:hypothetical protein